MFEIYHAALQEYLKDEDELNFDKINIAICSTGLTITDKLNATIKRKTRNRHKEPAWKERIKKEVELLRSEISILYEISRGTNVNTGKSREMKRKYQMHSLNIRYISEFKETLKQKLLFKSQQIRRFTKRSKFYRQNKIFVTDA